MTVAVLFARADSHYKALPGTDVYDIERDARQWPGGAPVVAHPPCRAWGRFRQFAKPRHDERDLAPWAVDRVRENGGVLEHPARSSLWAHVGLPMPGEFPDAFGGWTLEVEQFHWGHLAEKRTWLYVVGCARDGIPPIPFRAGTPTHVVAPSRRLGSAHLPCVSHKRREETPPAFAAWLLDLAGRCGVQRA